MFWDFIKWFFILPDPRLEETHDHDHDIVYLGDDSYERNED